MQNIYLKSFCSQTVIFDIFQPDITRNEKIKAFWRLKKDKFQKFETFNAKKFPGNLSFSNCDVRSPSN